MSEQTVLITGAGRGVGKACVERFLAAGWRVAAGVRDVSRAEVDLAANERLRIVQLDVTRPEDVASAVALAEGLAGGALDCLVNNAAYAVMGAQEDGDLEEVRAMFETNLFGAAAVTQAVLPAMRRAGRGAIIQLSSIGARISNPLVGYYHATKYGLTALSEALAIEGADHGIRVSVIEPGMIDTDFPKATRVTGSLAAGEGPYADLFARLRTGFGAWRAMDGSSADDVACAVVAVASDPEAPFRIVVGPDAEHLARTRAACETDEEWQAALRGFLHL